MDMHHSGSLTYSVFIHNNYLVQDTFPLWCYGPPMSSCVSAHTIYIYRFFSFSFCNSFCGRYFSTPRTKKTEKKNHERNYIVHRILGEWWFNWIHLQHHSSRMSTFDAGKRNLILVFISSIVSLSFLEGSGILVKRFDFNWLFKWVITIRHRYNCPG